MMKKAIATILILQLVVVCFSFGTYGFTLGNRQQYTGQPVDFIASDPYYLYNALHIDTKVNDSTKEIMTGLPAEMEGALVLDEYSGKTNVVRFDPAGGYIEFESDIPKGKYNIEIDYISKKNNNTEMQIGLRIDGSYPYDEAQAFTISRTWRDDGDIRRDENDNDILPLQTEIDIWRSEILFNRQGFYQQPYWVYFSGGTHRIRIESQQDNVLISGLRLCGSKEHVSYSDYSPGITTTGKETAVKHEAEKTYLKSEATLYPTIDRTDSVTSPASPVKLRYNTIGQSNFSHTGQWISWKIDVPESGVYKLSFRARQNISRNMNSHRSVLVNEELLFEEMSDIIFPYSKDFYFKTLGDDEPYGIYLEKGENVVKMQVIASETSRTMRVVNDIIFNLNTIYRQIMMIVGPSPDIFMDYYIDQQIPDLISRFESISESLKKEKEYLDSLSESKASNSAEIEQMFVMIDSMIKDPYTIQNRMTTFQSNISSLSSWMSSISQQPLEIDYLLLSPVEESLPRAKGSFFQNLAFGFSALIGSYFEDYSSLGGDDKAAKVNVWVGVGRDQAQIIKEMTSSYFTPKYGVDVNLSLVQGSIMEATMAGKGPDIALFVGNGLPMNLAARKALVDISSFEGFDEISSRFNEGAIVPYLFKGGCYGLPLEQSFPVMFYRKDVLSELGIDNLPDTWGEFYDMIPVIQRANLTIGMGDANVMQLGVNQSPSFGFVFPSLVFQRGGEFYNESLTQTDFDSDIVLSAFDDWTNLYTQYNLMIQYDFFNRFRTGEMPLAIAPYNSYNQLVFAAPEIKGLWGIAPVPGTESDDGFVRRDVAASGSTGAVMFADTKDKDAGYKYLDWFTSDEMQAVYGRNIETLMGPAARYNTANYNALEMLPWTQSEIKILREQQKYVREVPVVTSTYYVNRELANAFRKVVYSLKEPKETLLLYNRSINKEMIRKDRELELIP